MLFSTNYAEIYSQVERKIRTLEQVSGLSLDEIIEKFAKGCELVPSKHTGLLTDLKGENDA